jgi:hypothetical protein
MCSSKLHSMYCMCLLPNYITKWALVSLLKKLITAVEIIVCLLRVAHGLDYGKHLYCTKLKMLSRFFLAVRSQHRL